MHLFPYACFSDVDFWLVYASWSTQALGPKKQQALLGAVLLPWSSIESCESLLQTTRCEKHVMERCAPSAIPRESPIQRIYRDQYIFQGRIVRGYCIYCLGYRLSSALCFSFFLLFFIQDTLLLFGSISACLWNMVSTGFRIANSCNTMGTAGG